MKKDCIKFVQIFSATQIINALRNSVSQMFILEIIVNCFGNFCQVIIGVIVIAFHIQSCTKPQAEYLTFYLVHVQVRN